MTLRKVQYQNWNADFAYAPPVEEGVVNTDHIVHATVMDKRNTSGPGPWVAVKLTDGRTLTCRGTPGDFLGAEA